MAQGKKLTVRLLYFDEGSLPLNPRLLLLKRSVHCRLAGQVEPPGGNLEPNESLEDGIIREMREETGLHLSQATIYPFFYFDFISDREHQIREFFFITTGLSKTIIINPEEHNCFMWAPLDQLSDYPLNSSVQSFLKDKKTSIQEFLTKHALVQEG